MQELTVQLNVTLRSTVDVGDLEKQVQEHIVYLLTEGYNQDGDGRYSFEGELVYHALSRLAEKAVREMVEEDCFRAPDGYKMIKTGENRETSKGMVEAEKKLQGLRVYVDVEK